MSFETIPSPPPPPAPKTGGHKSRGLAVGFSALPGLGHIYLGLYQRGVSFFLAFLAALWLSDYAELSGALVMFVFFFAMIDAHRMATILETVPPGQGSPAATGAGSNLGTGNLALGVFLLLVGSVLLYNSFYPLDLSFLADWWPLGLIAFGLWLVIRDLRIRKAEEKSDNLPAGYSIHEDQ